jgi:phosphoribosylamine--glycine ligase
LFAAEELPLFGPTQRAARLESSKVFAKEFMQRCGIPTARYKTCDTPAQAAACLKSGEFGFPSCSRPMARSGQGRGDFPDLHERCPRARDDGGQAIRPGRRAAGDRRMPAGREASFFVVSDGTRALPLGSAEDHKRALDGDLGTNTGGWARTRQARCSTRHQTRVMTEVVHPVLDGMRAEGDEFRGFCSWADADGGRSESDRVQRALRRPEAQVVLPMMSDDLSALLGARAAANCEPPRSRTRPSSTWAWCWPPAAIRTRTTREADSRGGSGRGDARRSRLSFGHGKARRRPGDRGGRVLTVWEADGLSRGDRAAYEAAGKISFDGMHYRKDIGAKALG